MAFLSSSGPPNKILCFLQSPLFRRASLVPNRWVSTCWDPSHILPLCYGPSTGNCFLQIRFILFLDGKSLRQGLWLSQLYILMAPGRWDGRGWSLQVLTGLLRLSVCPVYCTTGEQDASYLFGLMSPPFDVPSFESFPFWGPSRVRRLKKME